MLSQVKLIDCIQCKQRQLQ